MLLVLVVRQVQVLVVVLLLFPGGGSPQEFAATFFTPPVKRFVLLRSVAFEPVGGHRQEVSFDVWLRGGSCGSYHSFSSSFALAVARHAEFLPAVAEMRCGSWFRTQDEFQ